MEFVVIDVETANRHCGSICQVGVATFRNGCLSGVWGTLVDPEDSFSPTNMAIHGIRARHVTHAPNWAEVQRELRPRLEHRILASHTCFDLRAMESANERYGLSKLSWADWIDTCKVARTAWPCLSSYKLPLLARAFGISYQAHDATEDARCAGEVLLKAVHATGLALRDFSRKQTQPNSGSPPRRPRSQPSRKLIRSARIPARGRT